jgi:single-stranded-DNA-specific exonuclease
VVHPRIGEASAVEAARQRGLADLAGAGVALLLAWRVAQVHCGSARLPATLKALMMEMVRLATLGTIADVAPLRDANRSLCAVGLRTLRDTQLAGLRALLSATGLLKAERDEPLEAHHVGFVLGPRLNACGRVEHASSAVRLLTDADGAEADELAAMMDRANEQRRQVERDILDQAEQQVQQHNYAAADRRALVLAGEGWHPGVVGIVASRLVERYHRPVVLLGTVNGTAKGSARSVDGVSIHAMLTRCSDRLRKFGGHAMAAGLELATDDVPALRDALVEQVNGELPADRLRADVHVDACIEAGDCGLALFEQLRRLGPFGRGNPTPRLLLRGVVLDVAGSPVGRGGDHLSLRMRSGNCVLKGIGFGMGDLAPQLPRGTRVDVVFTPKVGSWQGRPQADLHVQDVRLAERVTAAA